MATLPESFSRVAFAHRALHDRSAGRPENSISAIKAAIAAGYGIEIDVQPSGDGQVMVFHDETLDRLTIEGGPINARSAAELTRIPLKGARDTIPTLAKVLKLVAGQVPLLIEIKDQDGAMGPGVGPLEQAVAGALEGYTGDVAVMSFNPHSMFHMARHAPDVPRGLTTSAWDPEDWGLPEGLCARLRDIPDFDHVGACFISHEWRDLERPRVQEMVATGVPVLCWTIRSPEEEAEARRMGASSVTFEGYLADPA
jgi:glycerophosphoryl diester phosphodiesterase